MHTCTNDEDLTNDSLENKAAFHDKFHSEIIEEFRVISDSELELASTYWEETRFPIIRQFYTALTEVVGVMVGIEKMDDIAILATPSSINGRTKEIETLLNSN